MRAFKARFVSTCPVCDERIDVGDLVKFFEGQVVHEGCEAVEFHRAREVVCSECTLVKPCECEATP